MPHIIRKPGFLGGTTLAVFMTLVHTVKSASPVSAPRVGGLCEKLWTTWKRRRATSHSPT
jgi:hypothetical protein